MRKGQEYQHGTVWAIDADGKRAGYQTFDIYPDAHVIVLDNADMRQDAGDNGQDNRRHGAGRAMLDELDRLYPEPPWLMASSEFADHTQDGVDFMRRRSTGGRRKIHTERCALEGPDECHCLFADRRPGQDLEDPD